MDCHQYQQGMAGASDVVPAVFAHPGHNHWHLSPEDDSQCGKILLVVSVKFIPKTCNYGEISIY